MEAKYIFGLVTEKATCVGQTLGGFMLTKRPRFHSMYGKSWSEDYDDLPKWDGSVPRLKVEIGFGTSLPNDTGETTNGGQAQPPRILI